MFYNIEQQLEAYESQISDTIKADTKLMENPEDGGLDPRIYCEMYIGKDYVAVYGNTRNLLYYGGFEYIDETYVRKIGNWTIFMVSDENEDDDSCRVLDVINSFNEESSSEEE